MDGADKRGSRDPIADPLAPLITSIIHRLDVVFGIDDRFDYCRAGAGERGLDGSLQDLRARSADGWHAEVMRWRLAVVLLLQFGAVERILPPDLLYFDKRKPTV